MLISTIARPYPLPHDLLHCLHDEVKKLCSIHGPAKHDFFSFGIGIGHLEPSTILFTRLSKHFTFLACELRPHVALHAPQAPTLHEYLKNKLRLERRQFNDAKKSRYGAYTDASRFHAAMYNGII